MRLDDLKQDYDVIVSLGTNCQVAHQLKKNGLRSFAGPFDWFVFESLSHMSNLFKNNMQGLYEPHNTIAIEKHDNTFVVKDERYTCLSYHDFHVSEGQSEITLKSYNMFIKKLSQRIINMKRRIQEGKKVLLVRTVASYKEAMELKTCFYECFHKETDILIVNYANLNEVAVRDWNIERVCSVEIPEVKGKWQGCDKSWEYILSFIGLNPYANLSYRSKEEDIFEEDQEVFFASGVYGLEHNPLPSRWINSHAVIYLKSNHNIQQLKFKLSSFYEPRTCCVVINGKEVARKNVQPNFIQDILFSAQFVNGVNKIEIISLDGDAEPRMINSLNSEDTRRLSFYLESISLQL
ncbi:DUF1796 family putative cysteine peptidase [Paenibacillus marinisediminis]